MLLGWPDTPALRVRHPKPRLTPARSFRDEWTRPFDDDKQVVVRADKGRSRRSVSTAAALQLSGSVATYAEVRPVIEDEAISTGRDNGVGITRGSPRPEPC